MGRAVRVTRLAPALAVAIAVAGLLWMMLSARAEPPRLRLVSGAVGGAYHGFAQALAELARRHQAPFTLVVLESQGANANARALAAGTAEIGLVQSDTTLAPGVRAIATLFPEVLYLVVRRDGGIARFEDLAGRRVALMPEGSGTNAVFSRLAAHYGFRAGDFDLRPMPPAEAAAALQRGEVDAMARMMALGADAMRTLLTDPELELLGLDQAEAIQLFAPALQRISVPRGALGGRPARPAAEIEAIGVQAILVAGPAVPEAAVRDLTALLFGQRNELVALDPRTALMQPPSGLKDLGFVIHPGAQAVFDADAPPFFVRYAETLALAVTLSALAFSAAWQVRRWIADSAKSRGDAYNLELAETIDAVRRAPDAASLGALEDRMFGIFHRVVADIDEDRLAQESIPTFDFVWRSAVDVLGQRRLALRAPAAEGVPPEPRAVRPDMASM